MESHSLLPSNSIKLEPASETDCVQGSTNEILTEVPVFDKMDGKIPASVKVEQPEVNVDYPGQEIHTRSQSYPSISTKEHSQMEMYGNIDLELVKQLELLKQKLSVREDRSQRFRTIVDRTASCNIQIMAGHSNTKSEMNEKDYKGSQKYDQCCHMSENVSSDIAMSNKLSLANENDLLQNVEASVTHTQISAKSVNYTFSASCGPQRIQTGDIPYMSDVDAPIASVDRHLHRNERTHPEEQPDDCDDYNTSFTEAGSLMYQKRKLLEEKPFKCDDSGEYFNQVGSLKCHKRRHTGEKPYKCDDCGAYFTEASSLKCHKRRHTGERPYKCDDCGASFSKAGTLKCHKRTHTDEKPYKCDNCNASFTQAGGLKSHKRRHTGEKPYTCDVCGASFSTAGSLKGHERTHSGEKPYKCDDCGASFTKTSSLKHHMRIHTGEKPYKCDNCDASFTRVGSLKSHNKTHTGEKQYKCDDCGAFFSHSGNLKRHKRKHTGEKPYKCDVCCVSFAKAITLKSHNRIHSGETLQMS